MSSFFARFWKGFGAGLLGFRYLTSGPRLWPLAVVPILVTTGLLVFGLVWGIENFSAILAAIAPDPTGFFSTFVFWTIKILSVVLFGAVLLLGTVLVSKIVVVPFNSLIAEKTLKFDGRLKEEDAGFWPWLKKSGRLALIAVFQAVFFIFLATGLMILSFVPFVQFFTWYIGLLIVAFDCADYSMEFANLGLRQKLNLFRSRLPEFSGFAVVVGLTFLIPVLNFVFLPVAVAGAARLVGSFEELWTPKGKELVK